MKADSHQKVRMIALAAVLALGFLGCFCGLLSIQAPTSDARAPVARVQGPQKVNLRPVSTKNGATKKPDLLKRAWRKLRKAMRPLRDAMKV